MADGTGVEGSCQLESTDAEEQPDENGTDVDSQWSATSYKLMDIAEPPRTEKRKALAFEIDLSQDLSFQGDGGDSSHMDDMNETESTSGSIGPGGDAGSSLSSDRKKREDSLPMEMKSSMISSTDSAKFTIDSVVSKGSNPESASGSTKTVINNKDKGDADRLLYMIWSGRIDPSKKDKDKEREEKIRQAREKLAEERQRKIDEMKEQQRLAQEKRERQLELRRKKIEELKSREEERRQAVGDRRKKFEETDRAKKEAILQKAKERLTRYEQWKTMGRRKGLAPGVSPPTKQFSFSTSVLYHRQNPEFSSSGTLNINVPAGHAESLMALNAIPENRLGRSFIAASAPPPTRHKSTVTLGATQQPKMRDTTQKPRKPRPASVGTSMPSFVKIESESPNSRSKSTDRIAKDKAKPPTPRRKEKEEEKKDKEGKEEAKKSELKKFPFRRKSEEKKIEKKKVEEKEKDKKKEEEVKKNVEEKEKDKKKEEEEKEKKKKEDKKEERKEEKKSPIKSFFERLSIPKRSKDSPNKQQEIEKEQSPLKSKLQKEKDKTAKEKSLQGSPAKDKAPVRSVQTPPYNEVQKEESVLEGKPEAELGRVLEEECEAVVVSAVKEEQKEEIQAQIPKADTVTEVEEVVEKKVEMTPEPVHVDETRGEEEGDKEEEEEEMAEQERTSVKQKHEVKFSTPEVKPSPTEQKITPKSQKNLELEDYKTKLAEKRRMAREKAEREAELERQRQEELRREEEERIRLEEEEQRRMEEEAIRQEEEARRAEEERLRMAIEAEEQRKREEAERLEAERKSKEDAERKGREEAERLEKERKERAKKEEEERLERKKRLEMIMKRVKVEPSSSASEKTRMESPTRMTNAASKTSLTSEESSEEKDEGSDREERHETRTAESSLEGSKFKSPLLQKLVDNKMQNGDSGTPKFKSPILQSIIGKKFGSRSGLDKTEDSSADMQTKKSVVTLSPSQEDLLRAGETEELEKRLEANGKQYTITIVGAEETEEPVESDASDKTVINSSLVRSNLTVDSGVSSTMLGSDQDRVMDSFMSVSSSMAGSAVSFNGVTSHNGDLHDSHRDLVDSSISMRTVDSWEGSQSGSLSYGGGLVDSHMSFEPHSEGQFEEIIDLNVTNKTLDLKSQQLQDNLLSNTGDLLNLNDIDNNIDNSGFDVSDVPKPIIAFEDNATRRQDVTDLLS
ncbi:hypothetical protein CHS0354_034282 [Potamilus streckersoni]|uniref:Uncharacterized protein n=1 Tax=Potamilus streckersoni TaxID=2493646 RepID=A0AAE0VP69_9BIVA|nr:hypothetical protein CHS0354_034282 [Potamilus streckersoni]